MKRLFLLALCFSLSVAGCKLSGGDGTSGGGSTGGGAGTGGGTLPPGGTGTQSESLLTNPLSSLCLSDNGVYVFASRGGKVLKSTNGTSFVVVDDTARDLNSVHCSWTTTISGMIAYLVGSAGQILQYDGTTLTEMISPTTTNLNAVFGPVHNDVLAVGDLGTVVHWDGSTWSQEDPWDGVADPPDPLPDLYGVHGSEAAMYVVGANRTVLKRLSSSNWTQMDNLPTSIPTDVQFNDVWVDTLGGSGKIFIVGSAGRVLQSLNGGVGWEDPPLPTYNLTSLSLRAVHGTSASAVLAVGDGGVILSYNGSVWAQDENPEEDLYSLYDVLLLSSEGFAVGADGTDTSANGVIMKVTQQSGWEKWFY